MILKVIRDMQHTFIPKRLVNSLRYAFVYTPADNTDFTDKSHI